jgi:hypothetical protein
VRSVRYLAHLSGALSLAVGISFAYYTAVFIVITLITALDLVLTDQYNPHLILASAVLLCVAAVGITLPVSARAIAQARRAGDKRPRLPDPPPDASQRLGLPWRVGAACFLGIWAVASASPLLAGLTGLGLWAGAYIIIRRERRIMAHQVRAALRRQEVHPPQPSEGTDRTDLSKP